VIPTNCNNYLPMALSLSLSKIFEKCGKSRIMKILNTNNFFSKNQFGFMTGVGPRVDAPPP